MIKPVPMTAFFILLVFIWPGIYGLSSYIRFGPLAEYQINELLVFFPMGIISALGVILPLMTHKYSGCLYWGLAGYLLASPIAYFATLYGGLVLSPWISTLLLGCGPILIFTYIGYKVGEKVRSHAFGHHRY